MTLEIYALDTETTGATATDEVIQLAKIGIPDNIAQLHAAIDKNAQAPYWNLYGTHNPRQHSPFFPGLHVTNEFFNPNVPINPHAAKIHGLSKLKLCNFPNSANCELPKNTAMIVAHNAAFDSRMLGVKEIPSICTWRLAQKIEKVQQGKFGFEDYKLFTIFAHFYPKEAKIFDSERHDALADCEMLLMVLVKLLEQFPFLPTLTKVQEYFFAGAK